MRFCPLVTTIMAGALALSGCGGDAAPTQQHQEPFALAGSWLYLGPSDGPHTLVITDSSMVYADVSGAWKSSWTVKSYDNDLHHFQVTFDSGNGTYLPTGQSSSGAYEVNGTLLTVQLAKGTGSYPALEGAGSCTGGDGNPLPECRLYVHQN
jgi:hypothetical protein